MEPQTYYLIYQTRHIDSGKIYIGKHVTKNPNDSYLGSGKYICRAIKKYGRQAFEKTILFYCSSEEELNLKEKEIVTEEFLQTTNTYNMRIGGEGGYIGKDFYNSIRGVPKSPEAIQKGAEKRKGQKRSLDSKEKMSKAHKTEFHKEIARNNLIKATESITGIPFSEEHRQKIAKALQGHEVSLETRKKISLKKVKKVDVESIQEQIKRNPILLQKDILTKLHICDTTLRKALSPLSWNEFRQKVLNGPY